MTTPDSHPSVAGKIIRIAAALVCRPDGHTLLVRKRGTTVFIQPGGKIEPNETPLAALLRELREELALNLEPKNLSYLGAFTAPAANESGYFVQAEVFRLDIEKNVHPAAEIEEIIWLDPASPTRLNLAPLTRDFILPHYVTSLAEG